VLAEAVLVHNAIATNKSAYDAARASTIALKNANKHGCKVINDAGAAIVKLFPNNPEKWTGYGFEKTMDVIPDRVAPDKVENGPYESG